MSHRTEQKWLHYAFCECFSLNIKVLRKTETLFFQALRCLSVFSSWFSRVKYCNYCVDFSPEGPVISLITFQHAGQPCSLRTCPASSCCSFLHFYPFICILILRLEAQRYPCEKLLDFSTWVQISNLFPELVFRGLSLLSPETGKCWIHIQPTFLTCACTLPCAT